MRPPHLLPQPLFPASSAGCAACRIAHGGAPAPWSTTAGGISDTRDITRIMERASHLDDPRQRRIYDAEVTKVGRRVQYSAAVRYRAVPR